MAEWLRRRPADGVITREVGRRPPPFIDEAWIAAAFAEPQTRTPAQKAALAVSDELIAELEAGDVIVVATPMYNYGLPAGLKAWVDQVVRIGRTFSFDLDRGDFPLEPLLSGKTMVLLTASGEFGFAAGGARADMNHLDTHLRTLARYFGADAVHHLAIEYQEFGDARHAASVATAHAAVPGLVERVIDAVVGAGLPLLAGTQ
jgi:FMN-dependent NADH-azoreductase